MHTHVAAAQRCSTQPQRRRVGTVISTQPQRRRVGAVASTQPQRRRVGAVASTQPQRRRAGFLMMGRRLDTISTAPTRTREGPVSLFTVD
jgi:hypothetical protein